VTAAITLLARLIAKAADPARARPGSGDE
jgi:hypothetical protein